jgi:hypothetical protein
MRSVMVLPTLWDAGRGIRLGYMRKAFGFDVSMDRASQSSDVLLASCLLLSFFPHQHRTLAMRTLVGIRCELHHWCKFMIGAQEIPEM